MKNAYKSVELNWLKTGDINCTPDGEYSEGMEYKRTKAGMDLLVMAYNGEYDSLTDCQKHSDKLSRESFYEIQAFLKEAIKTEEDLEAILVTLVINDLGKINSFVEEVAEKLKTESVDHDIILFKGLESMPELSPSFNELKDEYKTMILSGLKTAFNMGQFVQSECMLNNVQPFIELDKRTRDFYLIHSLFDVAGAAGHVVSNGSPILTESYWQNFKTAKNALYNNTVDVMAEFEYLEKRGETLGLNVNVKNEMAAIKICNMARVNNPKDAEMVLTALKDEPEQVGKRVIKELTRTQTAELDGSAILLYYAPAMFCNYIKVCGDVYTGVFELLPILAALYGNIRNAVSGDCKADTVIAFAAEVAEAAKRPDELRNSIFSVIPVGDDLKITVTAKEKIEVEETSTFDVKGDNILVIGIGGGTDVVQGAMLAKYLLSGRCDTVVSIRSSREINSPKKTIVKGTYEIGELTTTTNRYVEDVPYNMGLKTYLIVDSKEDDQVITSGIRAILDLGKYDSILCVDTGGDCMFSESIDDKSYSPDQDRKVLNALMRFGYEIPIHLAIIAPDIDAPNGKISDTLKKAKAKLYSIPDNIAANIVQAYDNNGVDGTDPRKFGKTQLTWKAALSGKTGITTVNIPISYVLNDKNAWIPTVIITDSTPKVAVCRAVDLLNAT